MTLQEAIEFLRRQARFTRNITAIPCDGDKMLLRIADEFDSAADTVAALEAENERLRAIEKAAQDYLAHMGKCEDADEDAERCADDFDCQYCEMVRLIDGEIRK
jgi:Na+/phosphate symporter